MLYEEYEEGPELALGNLQSRDADTPRLPIYTWQLWVWVSINMYEVKAREDWEDTIHRCDPRKKLISKIYLALDILSAYLPYLTHYGGGTNSNPI